MRRAGLLPVVLLCAIACAPAEPIGVTNAWIRPPVPGSAVAAGYFDIVNQGDTPVVLTGARCDASPTIEMHTTVHDGDLLRMRPVARVELAPGAKASFAEGGQHLMLLHFTGVTTKTIPVTLQFSDGVELTVPFEVRPVTGAPQS